MAAAMLAAVRCGAARGLSGSRPNIVWIMADDLGYGEPSYMATDSPHGRISTPNIDRLSSEGLRFTSAYTGEAVCSPSRGSLMTGYHTGHAYIRGNYPYDGHDLPLRNTDVTYAEVLRGAGYRTLWVGKSGLGWVDNSGAPWRLGFDYFYGQPDQAGCHDMYPVGYNGTDPAAAGRPTVFDNTTALYLPQNVGASRERCMQQGGGGCWYTHDAWTNKSLELIEQEAARQRAELAAGAKEAAPFALLVAYTDPHAGGWSGEQETGAPVPSDGQYGKEAWPDVERDHASVISNYLDRDVGRIVQALQQQGLQEDTVVFFASDNGAHNEGGHDVHFFNSSGPLRGYKRALFEGGVRSPSWIRWPGKVAPGTSDQPWAFWDVLPTFADLAGANRSAYPADIDGRSIVPLIDGSGAYNASERLFYFEFCTDIQPWVGGSNRKGWTHSLRQGDWKIVAFELDGEYMLSNLADDLGEENNLASSHPDIVQRMAALAKGQHTESALFPSHDCRPS